MSKRDVAFALFCQDKGPSSPEIKALGIAPGTRYTYFSSWNKLGNPDHYPHVPRGRHKDEQKAQLKKIKARTVLASGEAIGGYEEPVIEKEVKEIFPENADDPPQNDLGTSQPETPVESETKPELKPELETSQEPESPVKPKYGDDHKELTAIPEEVIGAGLRIEVTVSLKTLAFFEVAHTIDPHLSLGDFIDDCVVDFFTGRGKDFGLLEVKKEVTR